MGYTNNHIDLERYIYKLIPDYAYIDYAEKMYWMTHTEKDTYTASGEYLYKPDEPWYDLINLLYNVESTSYNFYRNIGYGRCLVVSPVHLEFEEHPDEIICQLKNYGDRYVYACFSSDDELLRQDFRFKGNDIEVRDYAQWDQAKDMINGDLPYAFVLRF